MSRRQFGRIWAAAALLMGCGGFLGCKEREPEPRVITLEGVVEQVDLKARVVTVRFYSEKHETTFRKPVHVSDQTEVFINGALAKLEDVKVGERAAGTVRIDRHGDDAEDEFTALRVEIKRSAPLKPTSGAAEPASSDKNPSER
jgi:hypothetical protein